MLDLTRRGLSIRPTSLTLHHSRPMEGSDVATAALNFVGLAIAAIAFWPFLNWALFDAVWSGTQEACRAADAGACWVYVGEKLRFFILGFYPQDLQWRPVLATSLLVALAGASLVPVFWRPALGFVWIAQLPLFVWLMGGGAGLQPVATSLWSGLPLTVMLASFGLVFAFPLGILLALGRQSDLPLIRICCAGWIEFVRGVPLISILFMSNLLLPFFLPGGIDLDKLLRVQIGFAIFASAYLAEVVRGGLQGVPQGQREAAAALGLRYWATNVLVVLPQALRISIPPLVNSAIAFFKDTSLVIAIGLFDLLGSVRAASKDSKWLGYAVEGYLAAAVIYFLFCFAFSRAGVLLERRGRAG